jgi:hypothetical protein
VSSAPSCHHVLAAVLQPCTEARRPALLLGLATLHLAAPRCPAPETGVVLAPLLCKAPALQPLAASLAPPLIRCAGADAFFPVFLFVVIRSCLPRLASNVEYIKRFRMAARLNGQFDFMLCNLVSVKAGRAGGWRAGRRVRASRVYGSPRLDLCSSVCCVLGNLQVGVGCAYGLGTASTVCPVML